MSVSGVTTLSGLTLRNGQASDGGGLYNSGTLTIVASVLTTNIATSSGGGLYNSGRLVLQHSLVGGNEVSATVGFGGGIGNDGSLTIENSTIQGNTSPYIGGLYNSSFGTAEIANSTFNGNEATVGYTGALHNQQAMTLTNVTVSGNLAVTTGGGVGNTATGTLIVLNSTIANNENTSGFGGGGLHTFGISVTLKNTILAANLPANCGFGTGASVTSLGYNLDSGSSCGLAGTGDVSNVDPTLGPRQNNGGPTDTHALLPGSPAIDTGTNNGCPATDQRGFSRPRGAACDKGAFEWFDLVRLFLPLILK